MPTIYFKILVGSSTYEVLNAWSTNAIVIWWQNIPPHAMCIYINARARTHTHTHTQVQAYICRPEAWLNFLPQMSVILFVDTSRLFLYVWVWNVSTSCVCKLLSSSPFLLYPQHYIATADLRWLPNTILFLTVRHCYTQSGSQHILRKILLQNKLGNVLRT